MQYFFKIVILMGCWWVMRNFAILSLKGAYVPKFLIFARHIKSYCLFNFDAIFLFEFIELRAFDRLSIDFLCLWFQRYFNFYISHPILMGFFHFELTALKTVVILCYCVVFCRSLFVLLAIALSGLFRFTVSDYPLVSSNFSFPLLFLTRKMW